MAYYVGRPKDPRQTNKPGYMKDPDNVIYDEHISMAKGWKGKYQQTNHVVLDLTEQKLIKNSFNANRNFEEIFGHFVQNYETHIKDSMKQLTGVDIDSDLENTPVSNTVPTAEKTGMKSDGISSS